MGNTHATEDKSSSTSIGSKGRRRSKVFGRFGKKTRDPSGTQIHGAGKGEGHSDGAESKSLDRQSESTNSFDQLQEGSLDYDIARDALSVDVESRGAECTSQQRTKRPAPAVPHSTSSSASSTAQPSNKAKAITPKDDHVLLTPKQDEASPTAGSVSKASTNSNDTQTPLAKIAEAGSGSAATLRLGLDSRVNSTSSKHAPNVVPPCHASTRAEYAKPPAEHSIAATRTSTADTKTTKAATTLSSNAGSGVEPLMEVTTAESALVQRTREENGENAGGKSTGEDVKLVAAVGSVPEPVIENAQDASQLSPSLTAVSSPQTSDSQTCSRSIDRQTNRKSFVESAPISADYISACRETRGSAVPSEIPSQQNQSGTRTRLTSRSSASGAGREVFIETDSWRTVETLVAGICCPLTSSDNLEIGTGDVIIIREQTASSSSDSLFTDPLTPLGFAAELNQCYVSEGENACETADEEALREITKAALEARNYPRKTSAYSNIITYKPKSVQILSNLSVSEISYLSLNGVQQNDKPVEVIVAERKPGERISDGSISNEEVFSSISEDLGGIISEYKSAGAESSDEMPIHFRSKILPASGSDVGTTNGSNVDGKNGSSEPGKFNVAKAKKVELQNLSSRISEAISIPASADSTPGKTCSSNDAQPCVVISERTSPTMLTTTASTATSPESLEKPGDDVNADVGKGASSSAASTTSTTVASPASATMPTGTLTCSPIQSAVGDRNVLTKVASFIVERSNGDNTAKRPSHVPEKLNFAACEKFEEI